MSAKHTPSARPKAFESAYPGSMCEREDGDYLRRDDPASLAAALVELIASRDRELADLRDAHAEAAPDLLAAAQCAANVLSLLSAEVDALGHRACNVRDMLCAAIAKATGEQS